MSTILLSVPGSKSNVTFEDMLADFLRAFEDLMRNEIIEEKRILPNQRRFRQRLLVVSKLIS